VADTPAPETLEGERKTVTALFADIKGSMELIEDLDPEEARVIVDPSEVDDRRAASLRRLRRAVDRRRYLRDLRSRRPRGSFAARSLYAAVRMLDDVRR
jgi:hypothetical protein